MMIEGSIRLGDDEDDFASEEDLSDTEADVAEFAKSASGDEDLSDTEADVAELQEGDQDE